MYEREKMNRTCSVLISWSVCRLDLYLLDLKWGHAISAEPHLRIWGRSLSLSALYTNRMKQDFSGIPISLDYLLISPTKHPGWPASSHIVRWLQLLINFLPLLTLTHMEMLKEEKKLNIGYTCEKLLMEQGQLCTGFRWGGGDQLKQSDHRVETGSSCYGSNSASHRRAIMLWLPFFSLSRSILPPNKLLMHQPHRGRINCNTSLTIILNQVQMALCPFWWGNHQELDTQ